MVAIGIYLFIALLLAVIYVMYILEIIKLDRFFISILFGIAIAQFLMNAYEEYYMDKIEYQVDELIIRNENLIEQQKELIEVLEDLQ